MGGILSGHNALTYLALAMAAVIWFFLYKTPTGLRMRAVGENPNAASSVGQNVIKIQFLAIVLCGLMTGLGGMYLSMGYLTMFVRDMTAGRGFIALAACSMGQVTPAGVLISSMIFAFFDGLSNILQVLKIPSEFIQMLPYLADDCRPDRILYSEVRGSQQKNKKIRGGKRLMALDKESKTAGKKQYHIDLKPGDVGKYVLLPGLSGPF